MSGKSRNSVQSNTVLLLGAAVTRLGLSFWFIVYATTVLDVDRFGIYSLVVHFFELCLSLSATAVCILLTREISRRPRRLAVLLNHAVILTIGLLCLSQFLLFGYCKVVNYSGETQRLMALAAFALAPATMNSLFEACFMGLERARFVTVGTIIDCVLRFGGGGFALYRGFDLTGVIVALIVSRCAMAVFYWSSLRRLTPLRCKIRLRRLRCMIRRWTTFAGENWLATFYTTLDVLVLSAIRSEAEVGLYSAAMRLVRLGTVALGCYTAAVYPVLSRLHKTSTQRFQQLHLASLRMMQAMTLPVALVVTLQAEQIIGLIYDPQYLAAAGVLRIVIWAIVFDCLNPFLSYTLFARDEQSSSLRVATISFSTRFCLLLTLVPLYGRIGTASAVICSGLVATLCYCYFALSPLEAKRLLSDIARIGLALVSLSVVVLLTPEAVWLFGVAAGCAMYGILLLTLRVVRVADLQLMRS